MVLTRRTGVRALLAALLIAGLTGLLTALVAVPAHAVGVCIVNGVPATSTGDITGTAGDDEIICPVGAVAGAVRGQEGDDTITILANAIVGGVFGQGGSDTITVAANGAASIAGDYFNGGPPGSAPDGNDTINVGTNAGTIYGDAGSDIISLTSNAGTVRGDNLTSRFGNDTISATTNTGTVDAGGGTDDCSGVTNVLLGTTTNCES